MELETLKDYYIKVIKAKNEIKNALKPILLIKEKVGEHETNQSDIVTPDDLDKLEMQLRNNISAQLWNEELKRMK